MIILIKIQFNQFNFSQCNDLLKNNASSVSQLLKTPVLYPEINGLSCTKRAVYVLKFDGNLTASGVSGENY